jgi:signal transduction histidine kinase
MPRSIPALGSRVTDLVYSALALVAAVLTLVGEQLNPWVSAAVLIALVPWVLVTAGVRLPLAVFALLAILPLVPVIAVTGIGAAIFLTLVAASRVASRSDQPWLVAIVTAVVVVLPFMAHLLGFGEWDVGAIYFAFGGAFGVLVGLLVRRSAKLGEELRRADAELVQAAAREERDRIARDVHDLVAHSLTVVVLHVGGARRVLRSNPDAAEAALVEAERVARESLDAIRGAVGMLRDDHGPEVGSLDLERLVTTYRSAGMPVTLAIEGAPEPLSLPLRLTLFRVVQEGLANAARHSAPGSTATVAVSIDDRAVDVRISNPFVAPTHTAGSATRGYGLVGLREQLATLGGDFTTGPEGGSWVVACRLPIERAS